MNKNSYTLDCVMWIATAAAVIAGLIITERIAVFWFLLIPLIGTMAIRSDGKKNGGHKDD